jgi:hypothetical protein
MLLQSFRVKTMNTPELQCQAARCRFQRAAEELGQLLMRPPSDRDCPEWRKKYLELDAEVKRTFQELKHIKEGQEGSVESPNHLDLPIP